MEFVSELTARLENKPGRLAKICAGLAKEKINIRALSVMDTEDRACCGWWWTNWSRRGKVLTSLGVESTVNEVLAVELENRPGRIDEGAGEASGRAY